MFRSLALATAFGLLTATTAVHADPQGLAGPYLAARTASGMNDYAAASTYYTRALIRDPRNPLILESAFLAHVAQGDFDQALPVARAMEGIEGVSRIGEVALLGAAIHDGDYETALAELEAGNGAGPLVEGLSKAWVHLGLGRMSEAAEDFDAVAEIPGMESFALYHKALALASVGDFEGADAIFSGEAAGPLRVTRRGVLAHAQILSQLERNEDAIALIDAAFGDQMDSGLAEMRAAMARGDTLPFSLLTTPQDGVAEVFYSVASALSGEQADVYTLVYARIAEYLRPDHVDDILLTASILEQQGQYGLATEVYNKIPRDDPAFHVAELGRAEALIRSDRTDAAVEALQQLAKSRPEIPGVWASLGDTLRRIDRFEEATRAYDRAIALFDTEAEGQWPLYYARGICHERQSRWELAEADFRKALTLSPDQPQVLNYMGYSFLEMDQNLDEALGMIERAVSARPDDGYIVDSLGWALYRMGRYDEAVPKMERAVELEPVDSIVNDHLGDVYWAVGRKREAEFQWKRALSFGPQDEAETDRIRRKIAVGLDKVLAEEGAAPLALTQNDR